MAINNWRYVVTWGYMDPSGRIVEETQWVPDTSSSSTSSSPTFSTLDDLSLRAQWYYDMWDKALWDLYSGLWKDSNAYANTAKQMNAFYGALAEDVANRERNLAWAKYDLANRLNQDILSQRQYVMDTFWPEGTLTKEINQYYGDLSNYLSSEAWREAAKIAAQWVHSGASLGAIRAQQNEAYNQAFSRYVQAKEQEINAKQTIASNLINYMSTLRQEYWNTTNQYIIAQYERANDLLNNLSSSIASANAELAQAKLAWVTKWWGSSSGGSSAMTWQDYLAVQDYMDKLKNGRLDTEEDPDSIVETSQN